MSAPLPSTVREHDEMTPEQYRCLHCLHTGPAVLKFEREPHGEMLAEPKCENCLSDNIYEILED